MSELSKVALQVDSNQSFPNNNNGYITPAILRSYNTNVIDSTVNQIQYTADSGSWNSKIGVLNGQTGSYATTGSNTFRGNQIITGSVTASFFKGDGSALTNVNAITPSLNAFTASQDEKNLTLATYTGSVDEKFTTIGTYTSSQDTKNVTLAAYTGSNDTKWTTLATYTASFSSSDAEFNAYTQSQNTKNSTLATYTGSNDTKWNTLGSTTASLNTFTSSQESKDITLGTYTSSIDTKNSTLAVYTASVDTKFTTIGLLTGSYATTGSNNFKGVETIGDIVGVGTGEVYLLGRSGSLVIGANGLTPTYAALAHLSSSVVNSNVNLIIKNSTTAADTIISGSGNIFVNPTAPTAGFKRYIGTSNIYPHGNSIPQISGSMAWSPSANGNIISHTQTNAVTWRGPVSSSASTFLSNILMGSQMGLGTSAANNFEKSISGVNITGNALFNGQLNQIANTTPLSSSINISGNLIFGGLVSLNHLSSSVSYNSNVTNGSTTVNNRFLPSGSNGAITSPRVNTNTLYGTGHVINMDGTNVSATQGKQFVFNILAGTYLTASVPDGDACNVLATGMIGNGLVVTGSTLTSTFAGNDTANSGQGSLFAGRFNSLTGTADQTAETVFAVGTGTGYSNRKTGFLIDSGSNTFVEGTLNVSGGVFQNVVPITIASQTASLDLSQGTYFTLTLANNATTHIKPINLAAGVSATLVITTGTNSTASLAPTLLQPFGNAYSASIGSGSIDILALTSTNSSNMFVISAKNMI